MKLAAALLACVCAPSARAQEGTTPKAPEAVRERRVEAAAAIPASAPSAEAVAELEALRAQAESAATPAERGRLSLALAERLAQTGLRAEAVELLRTVSADERFDPQLFYNAGNALARLGESEAAADAYRKAVAQRRGNYARAQHNLGVVLTRLGRWEEAEESLRSALRLESNTYAEASYSLGRLHALRGESGLAAAEWARTLRLKPDHADAAAALARSLAEGGDAAQALAVLDSFAAGAQRRGAPLAREITVARGEIVAAANVAAAMRASGGEGPARADAAAGGGVVDSDARASALPDSTAILRAARAPRGGGAQLVVDRQSFTLLRGARAARAEERNEEAAALYRRAIREGGGYLAPANVELGLTLFTLRRNEEAAATLLAVVRKDGARYPLVFYHLGRIYEHLGRLGEAGEAFARAAELAGEESPQFYVDLSRVREREGRGAEALSAAEAYVRLMGRAGATPDWARERVENLRKKAGRDAAPPPSNQ